MVNVTLTRTKQEKWLHNVLVFLAPLGILYLTTIIGVVSQENHIFTLSDFIPSSVATGGIILWILNSALDYLRKLRV